MMKKTATPIVPSVVWPRLRLATGSLIAVGMPVLTEKACDHNTARAARKRSVSKLLMRWFMELSDRARRLAAPARQKAALADRAKRPVA
jgi:hypothetical protein